MTGRLVLLRGLPGAGKSTLAAELADGGAIVTSRDNIRRAFSLGFGENEDLVAVIQLAAVASWLDAGRVVVVDDLNLHPDTVATWREYAAARGVSVQVVGVDTPVDVCVARDAERPDGQRVGGAVIRQLARGEMTHVQEQVATSLARAVQCWMATSPSP